MTQEPNNSNHSWRQNLTMTRQACFKLSRKSETQAQLPYYLTAPLFTQHQHRLKISNSNHDQPNEGHPMTGCINKENGVKKAEDRAKGQRSATCGMTASIDQKKRWKVRKPRSINRQISCHISGHKAKLQIQTSVGCSQNLEPFERSMLGNKCRRRWKCQNTG